MSDTTDLAHLWARRGFPAFPVAISRDEGRLRKRPLTDHGHHDATTDPEALSAMFVRRTRDGEILGVGLNPGPAGFLVLDPDRKNGIDGVALADSLGLPQTWTVDTAGQGEHRYFRHPGGHIGNSSPWPGIDVRADGGWVVAPGTPTPWGNWTPRVAWDPVHVAELPPAVAALLRGAPAEATGGVVPWVPWMEKWIAKALSGAATDVRKAPEGKRNDELSKHAGYVARKLAGSGAPESMWEKWVTHFTNTGLTIGLDSDEIARMLKRARTYGDEKPHPIGNEVRMETRQSCRSWLSAWMDERGGTNIPRDEVLTAGMAAGYYNRTIQRAAVAIGIVVTHAGVFPKVSLWSVPWSVTCVEGMVSANPVDMVPATAGTPLEGRPLLEGRLCKNLSTIGTRYPGAGIPVVTGETPHQQITSLLDLLTPCGACALPTMNTSPGGLCTNCRRTAEKAPSRPVDAPVAGDGPRCRTCAAPLFLRRPGRDECERCRMDREGWRPEIYGTRSA